MTPRSRVKLKRHEDSLEVTYGIMFPDVVKSPEMAKWPAGTLKGGMFYPIGSMAGDFFKTQQAIREASSTGDDNRKHVYFIRAKLGGPVKIGIAKDVEQRLAALQTGCPFELEVLAVIPHGARKMERLLHRQFKSTRIHGEWFQPSDALSSFVANLGAKNETRN